MDHFLNYPLSDGERTVCKIIYKTEKSEAKAWKAMKKLRSCRESIKPTRILRFHGDIENQRISYLSTQRTEAGFPELLGFIHVLWFAARIFCFATCLFYGKNFGNILERDEILFLSLIKSFVFGFYWDMIRRRGWVKCVENSSCLFLYEHKCYVLKYGGTY